MSTPPFRDLAILLLFAALLGLLWHLAEHLTRRLWRRLTAARALEAEYRLQFARGRTSLRWEEWRALQPERPSALSTLNSQPSTLP